MEIEQGQVGDASSGRSSGEVILIKKGFGSRKNVHTVVGS